ncbi:MAG: hypothetical protein LBQ71_17305 [Hungatella sp.]|jgi:hypothetical protein|nr:hypothetical protein [Hungatella sp.]
MSKPVRIADELYFESHYGSETLMHILVERILEPAGFDSGEVGIVIR